MAGISRKNLDEPDELVELPSLTADVVEVAGLTVARLVHQPGWRWSTHVKPEVGGEWCQARHVGTILAGRHVVVHQDGSETELEPGTSSRSSRATTGMSWERNPS